MPVTAQQTYDPVENILYVEHPGVTLETRDDIEGHFDRIVEYWQKTCNGRKAYYVVDYDGITVNVKETDFYALQIKRVATECAVTVVRYGGDSLQRAASRLANMKIHLPSQLYASRAEALTVVRALQAGTMTVGAPRPQ